MSTEDLTPDKNNDKKNNYEDTSSSRDASQQTSQKTRHQLRRYLWQGQFGPAFWTLTGIISLTVNIVLLIILIALGRELFALKQVVSDQLLGGLYKNFVAMDEAVIETTIVVNDTIQVQDTIPVQFDLPVETETSVILTEPTEIKGTRVNINTGVFTLRNAPADIVLPENTELPAGLNILVPVETSIPINLTVPVSLNVPVSIPLNKTELHDPFVGLQEVVLPYNSLLAQTPNSWEQIACQSGPLICRFLGEGTQ